MKTRYILLLTGLSVLLCAPLDAQRKGKGKRGSNVSKIFAKLDKNDDGKITKEEAKGSRLEGRFEKIDKDKDGAITKKELAAGTRGKGGRGGKGRKRKGGGKGK